MHEVPVEVNAGAQEMPGSIGFPTRDPEGGDRTHWEGCQGSPESFERFERSSGQEWKQAKEPPELRLSVRKERRCYSRIRLARQRHPFQELLACHPEDESFAALTTSQPEHDSWSFSLDLEKARGARLEFDPVLAG